MDIGAQLNNRYTLTARLGRGAMGQVYRATDAQTGQDVAVKVVARDLSFDPEMLERFRREGEALRQLRHPNIVGFVDMFEHEGQQVIVMEYVPGGSLHELIKQGSLPIERARRIALELCDALTRAHHLNIVHRDIKPENVLLAEDGTPKLTDFGVARLLSEGTRLTGTGTQVGTPYYMAPEAWEGKPLDAQADIWSLGVVLFEMLTGEVPFGGDTAIVVMNKVLNAPLSDLRQARVGVPAGLAQIVQKMLTRDKAARYASMRLAAVDLERGEAGVARRAIPRSAAGPSPRLVRLARGGLRLLGWVLGAGAVFCMGFILFALVGTWIAAQIIQGAIASANWNLTVPVAGEPCALRETNPPDSVIDLTPSADGCLASYAVTVANLAYGITPTVNFVNNYVPDALAKVAVHMLPPDQVALTGLVNRTPVSLTLSVTVEKNLPVLRFHDLNGSPLFIFGDMLAGGINGGLARALEKAGRKVTALRVESDQLVVVITSVSTTPGAGVALATVTPPVTPPPSPSPGATLTPPPAWVLNFAEPILKASASRAPDFQDDFSTASGRYMRWSRLENCVIADGVLKMSGGLESVAGGSLAAAHFVAQFDFTPAAAEASAVQFTYRQADAYSDFYNFEFDLKTGGWLISREHPQKGALTVFATGATDPVPPGKWATLTVVVRDDQMAVYLEQQPLAHVQDNSLSGEVNLIRAAGAAEVNIDNVKFWNLGKTPTSK